MAESAPRGRRAVRALLFLFCCAADAFVLRSAWTGTQVADGEFRRGYFESFDERIGVAMDGAIRPGLVPSFLHDAGGLAAPPGMVVVAPLGAASYTLSSDGDLPPYIVVGRDAAVAPVDIDIPLAPDEARLEALGTLAWRDGALALVPWDASRPWRDDAARLQELRSHCGTADNTPALEVGVQSGRLHFRLGRCALDLPLPSRGYHAEVAALAGPDWVHIRRSPDWSAERWIVWPILAAIALKVAALWWSLGALAALAASAALAAASPWLPVPAMLTWPLMLLVGVAAALLRAVALGLRLLPQRVRPLAAVTSALTLVALLVWWQRRAPEAPRVVPSRENRARVDRCAVLGYSTVEGEGLRHEWGGIREILDRDCPVCRGHVAGIFAGGEKLDWLRTNYCASPPSLGADGDVVFLGGANDDFLWGVLSLARLFIVGQQGPATWRRNQPAAARASLAAIDDQLAALRGLIECAESRRARFVFLHDFLVTDLAGGRGADRAAMLAHRRRAVEERGGVFVDLLERYSDEVGVAWFDDYVHFSAPAHARAAEAACAAMR